MGIPFPIAHLVRRARNAKGPKERHDTAFFAWEASVRIAVAAAPPADPHTLADPSTGTWVKWMRPTTDPFDAIALRKVTVLFTTTRIEGTQLPRTVNAKKVLEHLAAYRNEVHGHGSTRTGDYYDPAADILLEAIEVAWEAGIFLEKGKKLVYVESVELRAGGERRARIVDLDGIAPLITSPREGSRVTDAVSPRRLYVSSPTISESAALDLHPIHPWLLYEESELRERVLFFNGRRKSARYLDYVGGEILKGAKLQTEFPTLEDELERTFGQPTESAKETTSGEAPASDPNRIGDYQLLGTLGEGGMGVVHLARQESLGRTVALKVLHPGAAEDPIAVARFKREILALAKLDHKNIVSILDSGEDKRRLYYAMELVEGVDLAELARELGGPGAQGDFDAAMTTAGEAARARTPDRTLPPDVTLPSAGSDQRKLGAARDAAAKLPDRVRTLTRLFRDAARAVHYLHGQGMIHRDLKPGNLMVTHADHRIVLMDLGLVAMGNASRSITKDTSSILGTLRYMPPEQLQRNAGDLDRRVDVYALGATFYELLTGRPLFDGDTEARLVQQVLHETPTAPASVAKLPADLCTILEKCLQKDRTLRYDNAEELANDLDAFLEARPISARAPTLSYVALMAARRNKPLTALIALSVVLVFAGLPLWALREKAAREHADALTKDAEAQRNDARLQAARILEEQGRQELTLGRPAAAFHDLTLSLGGGNDGPVLRFLLARAARAVESTVREIHAHDESIAYAAFAPDGKSFVTASTDRTLRLFDTASGAEKKKWDLGERVHYASFSSDSSRVLGATKRRIVLYDTASGNAVLTLDEPWDVVAPSVSPDGATLLIPTWNGEALLVAIDGGKVRTILHPTIAAGLSGGGDEKLPIVATFSPIGSRVLTASARTGIVLWDLAKEPPAPHTLPDMPCDAGREGDGPMEIRSEANGAFDARGTRLLAWSGCSHEARVFDVASGAEIARVHATGVLSDGMFTPDAKRVVFFGDDGRAAVYRADSGTLVGALHDGGVFLGDGRLSPDGTRIATLGDDDRTRLWDTKSGALLAALDGHRAPVTDLDFSKDGTLLLTASEDGVVLLRKTECNWAHATVDHAGEGVLLSQDGTATLSWDALGAELVDVGTKTRKALGTRAAAPGTSDSAILSGAFASDGSILTGGADGKARLFSKSGELVTTLDHGGKVTAVAFAPDAHHLLTAGDEKTVRLWDKDKKEPTALLPHSGGVSFAAFFDGGKRVLTRTEDDVVSVWNADTGAMVKTLAHKAAKFGDASVSDDPSAGRFAVPCDDGVVRVFDAQGELVGTLHGTRAEDRRARLSPDGTKILTTSDSKTARVWDVATGTVLFVLEGERSRIADGVYSPDGAFFLTSHDDGAARIWDARTGHLLDVAQAHREAVNAIGWSGDGTRFFTRAATNLDEEMAVWPLPQEKRPLSELEPLDRLRKDK
ncbi:hypothetical protein BH09MYX1_BH09MYX1_24230 [soil metagenome]